MCRDDLSRLVLSLVSDREVEAPELRRLLAAAGLPLSALAFDGLMAGLEAEGLIHGRYPAETPAWSGPRLYRNVVASIEAPRPSPLAAAA